MFCNKFKIEEMKILHWQSFCMSIMIRAVVALSIGASCGQLYGYASTIFVAAISSIIERWSFMLMKCIDRLVRMSSSFPNEMVMQWKNWGYVLSPCTIESYNFGKWQPHQRKLWASTAFRKLDLECERCSQWMFCIFLIIFRCIIDCRNYKAEVSSIR